MPTSPAQSLLFARAAAAFFAVLSAPALVAYVALAVAPANSHALSYVGEAGFAVLALWKSIVYPHDWFVLRSGHRSISWLSHPGFAAILQWAAVCVLFSVAGRRLRWPLLLVTAVGVILAVSAAIHFLLPLLGVTVEADLL